MHFNLSTSVKTYSSHFCHICNFNTKAKHFTLDIKIIYPTSSYMKQKYDFTMDLYISV